MAARLQSLLILLLPFAIPASAEPYLAVKTGQSCSACHVNPAGGGLRTQYGTVFGQRILPRTPLEPGLSRAEFTFLDSLRIGGNARFNAQQFDLEDTDSNVEFQTNSVNLYGSLILTDIVSLYVDQQVAPGGSLNREAWVKLGRDDWYIRMGKMFLPYGWRLEDDSAFIRQVTGINFDSSDNGIELGYDTPAVQAQVAVTNGAGGGGEIDDGKFLAFRGSIIQDWWRVGVSLARNDTDFGDRTLYGAFAGLRTGRIAWLGEFDVIKDESPFNDDEEQHVGLLEANIEIAKGHNLKLTLDTLRIEKTPFPDSGDRNRVSLVWETFPWSFTQFRLGVRRRDSDDQFYRDGQEYFLQTHIHF